MKILINTIDSVKEFVDICNKYQNSNIDVKQGQRIVNGKSILGMFSLNLVKSVNILIDSEDKNIQIEFYNNIKKWKVNNSN